MTEPTEQSTSRQRDMKRPHWQRTTGNVVAREIVGLIIDKPPYDLSPEDVRFIEDIARAERTNEPNGVWACAHALTGYTMHANMDRYGKILDDPELGDQFYRNTTLEQPSTVVKEGKSAQQAFPLNLAREVHHAAQAQGVDGFEARTLSDVAAILERPDFQALVMDATKTAQGVWRGFSSEAFVPFSRDYNGRDIEFQFQDGKVAFAPEFSEFLRTKLREVNQQALSQREAHFHVDKMASTGCPVAHSRPSFTNSPEDQKQLEHLSQLLGKTPEELTGPYSTSTGTERTIIHVGMDRTAEWLRAAEPVIDTSQFDKHPSPPKKTLKERVLGHLGLEKDVKAPDTTTSKEQENKTTQTPTLEQTEQPQEQKPPAQTIDHRTPERDKTPVLESASVERSDDLEIAVSTERVQPEATEVKSRDAELSAPPPLQISATELALDRAAAEAAKQQQEVAAELLKAQQQQALEQQQRGIEPER